MIIAPVSPGAAVGLSGIKEEKHLSKVARLMASIYYFPSPLYCNISGLGNGTFSNRFPRERKKHLVIFVSTTLQER